MTTGDQGQCRKTPLPRQLAEKRWLILHMLRQRKPPKRRQLPTRARRHRRHVHYRARSWCKSSLRQVHQPLRSRAVAKARSFASVPVAVPSYVLPHVKRGMTRPEFSTTSPVTKSPALTLIPNDCEL